MMSLPVGQERGGRHRASAVSGLSNPTARALVVAVSNYQPSANLASYRSIEESARQLQAVLIERCGMTHDRLTVLRDPTADAFRQALEQEADKAINGVFLFYYIGHGLPQTRPNEGTFLSLAASDTAVTVAAGNGRVPGLYAEDTVVRYGFIRKTLASLKQYPTVTILDCCFSAVAARDFSAIARSDFSSSTPRGDYLLAAAGHNELAFGPDPVNPHASAEPTWFTGSLVRLLTDGDPRLSALVTLEDCFMHLVRLAVNSPADRRMPVPWAMRSGEIGQLILTENRAAVRPQAPLPRPPDDAPCPYMGLDPYRAQDANLFRGRAKAVQDLVRVLPECVAAGVPLVLTGASGVGKSSLVQAGLVTSLENDQIPGWPRTHGWPVIAFAPDSKPLLALAACLGQASAEEPSDIVKALRADPGDVTRYLDRIVARRGRAVGTDRVVLLVDQFEEVFTRQSRERRDRLDEKCFVHALQAAAAGSPTGRHAVVIVVRGDYFVTCSSYPGLLTSAPRNDLVVQPMTDAELRSVVTEPAEQAGLLTAPQLVERLLADLRMGSGPEPDGADGTSEQPSQGHDAAGILPLISYALVQTFANREGRLLTLGGYEATGGIWQAVARAADGVYQQLENVPHGQAAARLLLLDMVQFGRNADDSRRRVELTGRDLGKVPARTIEHVARLFADARLVTLDRNADGVSTASFSHEAILRSWPTLREWIEADRAGLMIRQQLMDAVREWQGNPQDGGRLYRGVRLADTWRWASEPHRWRELPISAKQFLQESQRSEQQERRRARRAKIAIRSALTTVALAVAAVLVFQHQQAVTLRHQRDVAISQRAAASAETLRSTTVPESMLLALAAYRLNANQQTRGALLDTYSEDATATVLQPLGQFIQASALSPTQPIMVLGASHTQGSPAVTLWDVKDPMHARQLRISLIGPSQGVESVAFSPNGRVLVAAADEGDGGMWMWKLNGATTGTIVGTRLPGASTQGFDSATFSSTGEYLAATRASGQSTALVWDLDDLGPPSSIVSALPVPDQNNGIGPLAFAPGTRTLYATMGDGSVWSWDTGSSFAGAAEQIAPPSTGATALAFSDSGRELAIGSRDGELRLWRISGTTQTLLGDPIEAGDQAITAVAFSPDGGKIATGADDWSVKVWSLPSRQVIQTLRMDSFIYSVAFAQNGTTLLAMDGQSNAEFWEIPGSVITGPTAQVNSVAISPDGRVVAAASDDGTFRLWHVSDSHNYTQLGAPHYLDPSSTVELATAVAFSPRGTLLAVGDVSGDIYLWNVANPSRPVLIGRPEMIPGPRIGLAAAYTVTSLAFIPGRNVLIAGDGDGSAYFFDVRNPAAPAGMFSLTSRGVTDITQVSVDSSGRFFAYATDQYVYLSNIANLSHVVSLGELTLPGGAPNPFARVAFSHHGDLLATGGSLHNTPYVGALYKISSLGSAKFLSYISGPSDGASALAFSPDDKTLAGGSTDDDIWLWNVSNPASPTVAADLAGHTQWVTSVAFASSSLLISGSADTTVRLWDTDSGTVSKSICSLYPGTANFPSEQWVRWFGTLPYTPPCP